MTDEEVMASVVALISSALDGDEDAFAKVATDLDGRSDMLVALGFLAGITAGILKIVEDSEVGDVLDARELLQYIGLRVASGS